MTKTYSFGNLGKKEDKTQSIQDLSKTYDIENIQSIYDDLFKKYTKDLYTNSTHDYYTTSIPTTVKPSHQVISTPSYYPTKYTWEINPDDVYSYRNPKVKTRDHKVEVVMDDGSIEYITREELVKYIGERKLVRENEVVRKMYDRFQVAAKLARSDDDGDTGV